MSGNMGASEARQLEFGFVGATQHQVLTVHGDDEVLVMLMQHQLASVWGAGRGNLFSLFHE
jgi:hypothetical protein